VLASDSGLHPVVSGNVDLMVAMSEAAHEDWRTVKNRAAFARFLGCVSAASLVKFTLIGWL